MSGRNGTTGNRVNAKSVSRVRIPALPKFYLSRRRLWVLGGLAAASLVVLACAPAQYLGRQQDDLLYIVASESLLAGRGLRNLVLVGQPAMTSVSPLFPLLLAPLTWLSRGRYGWLEAFSALLLAASPWAIWLFLRGALDELTAALIAALCALSPFYLSQAGAVMSEPAFLLLTLALLWAARARKTRAVSWLLLAVTQLRSAGLALLPAACAGAWKSRRWRAAVLAAAPTVAAWLAWTWWSRASGSGAEKLDELALSYSAGGAARLARVVVSNAAFYASEWGSSALPERWGAGAGALAAGGALCAAAAAGCWKRLRQDPLDAALWALAGTAALHLVWPWQYERYLIMPLPLLYLAAAWGLGRRAAPVLGALLAAQILFHVPRWVEGTSWRQPELSRAYAAARAQARPGDVLASILPLRDGFLCGLPAAPLVPARDGPSLREKLSAEHATLVLWQDGLDLGLTLERTAVVHRELEAVRSALGDARSFRLVYSDAQEGARLYRVR